MVKIPFAYSKKLKRIIGIDEAKSGRDNYYCQSCKMELQARKGEDRAHHFKHHEQAEDECAISYWVSIRDIALQLVKKQAGGTMAVPPLETKQYQYPEQVSILSYSNSNKSDLILHTNIGEIHIYIVTPEHSPSSMKEGLSDYFVPRLSLKINLSEMEQKHKEAMVYIKDALFNTSNNKSWITPQYHMFYKPPKEIDIAKFETKYSLGNRVNKNLIHEEKYLAYRLRELEKQKPQADFDHDRIYAQLIIDTTKLGILDKRTAEQLIPFYKLATQDYLWYGQEKEISGIQLFCNLERIWAYERNGYLKFITIMGRKYIAYDVVDDNVVFIGSTFTLNQMLKNLQDAHYYPDYSLDVCKLDF